MSYSLRHCWFLCRQQLRTIKLSQCTKKWVKVETTRLEHVIEETNDLIFGQGEQFIDTPRAYNGEAHMLVKHRVLQEIMVSSKCSLEKLHSWPVCWPWRMWFSSTHTIAVATSLLSIKHLNILETMKVWFSPTLFVILKRSNWMPKTIFERMTWQIQK